MSEETLTQEQQLEDEVLQSPAIDDVENAPQQEMSELDQLIARRMGNFNVSLSLADLKYLRNKLNEVTWTGPNEAYLQIMAVVALSNEIRVIAKEKDAVTRHTISLPSTTIESINFFLSRVSGKGEEAAHRLFAVSMLLRPVMEEIKNIDDQINTVRNSQDSEKN